MDNFKEAKNSAGKGDIICTGSGFVLVYNERVVVFEILNGEFKFKKGPIEEFASLNRCDSCDKHEKIFWLITTALINDVFRFERLEDRILKYEGDFKLVLKAEKVSNIVILNFRFSFNNYVPDLIFVFISSGLPVENKMVVVYDGFVSQSTLQFTPDNEFYFDFMLSLAETINLNY